MTREGGTPDPVVLVVTTSGELREVVAELLEEHGYSALAASSSVVAFDLLRRTERAPAVILFDAVRPDVDGLAFRQAQQRDGALAEIPIVMLTASRDPAQTWTAASVLLKPFGAQALLDAIAHVTAPKRNLN